eukprot:Rmarinus@m.17530
MEDLEPTNFNISESLDPPTPPLPSSCESESIDSYNDNFRRLALVSPNSSVLHSINHRSAFRNSRVRVDSHASTSYDAPSPTHDSLSFRTHLTSPDSPRSSIPSPLTYPSPSAFASGLVSPSTCSAPPGSVYGDVVIPLNPFNRPFLKHLRSLGSDPCRSTERKMRLSRFASNVQFEDLQAVFHLPRHIVADRLCVCPTLFMKMCRKAGMEKWPYRNVKTIIRRIERCRRRLAAARTEDAALSQQRELQHCESLLRRVYEGDTSVDPNQTARSQESTCAIDSISTVPLHLDDDRSISNPRRTLDFGQSDVALPSLIPNTPPSRDPADVSIPSFVPDTPPERTSAMSVEFQADSPVSFEPVRCVSAGIPQPTAPLVKPIPRIPRHVALPEQPPIPGPSEDLIPTLQDHSHSLPLHHDPEQGALHPEAGALLDPAISFEPLSASGSSFADPDMVDTSTLPQECPSGNPTRHLSSNDIQHSPLADSAPAVWRWSQGFVEAVDTPFSIMSVDHEPYCGISDDELLPGLREIGAVY